MPQDRYFGQLADIAKWAAESLDAELRHELILQAHLDARQERKLREKEKAA